MRIHFAVAILALASMGSIISPTSVAQSVLFDEYMRASNAVDGEFDRALDSQFAILYGKIPLGLKATGTASFEMIVISDKPDWRARDGILAYAKLYEFYSSRKSDVDSR